MLTFRKKEKRVAELVGEHIDKTRDCLEITGQAIKGYLAGDLENARQAAREAVHAEAQADQILREIRDLLFSGAYLPLVRGDIFRLVEAVDAIANAGESCCTFFLNEQVDIPEEYHREFLQIYDESLDTFRELRVALKKYIKPKGTLEAVQDHVKKVSELESLIDENEEALTIRIFQSDMNAGQKVHIRQALRHIARISDRSEDTADQVVLAGLKSVL